MGDWEHLVSIKNLGCTCAACSGSTVKMVDANNSEINKRAAELAKIVYKGKNEIVDHELVELVAQKLMQAVTEGYGSKLGEAAYNSPDTEMLRNLQNNVYQFAAAENYHQLKDITSALVDAEGNILSFAKFKDIANKISYQYNTNYLEAEYSTAIGSAQMASRWVEIQKDKATFPTLIYRTVGDARVREAHKSLDGVKRLVGDSFWDTYYPPNGWRCRCDVEQHHSDYQTDESTIKYPEVAKMFRTNLAKDGLVFPKDHPYFIDAPDEIIKISEKLQSKKTLSWAKINLTAKNTTVKRDDIEALKDKEISFTNKGLKEVINQPHKHKFEKNMALYNAVDLIQKAEYVRADPNIKLNEKPQILLYHYLKIMIKKEYSWIVLEEKKNGEVVLFSIVDRIKE